MTAKEYLSKIQTLKKAIESKQQTIEYLYSKASGVKAIVYDKDRVQTSPENHFETIMVQIDAEAEKMGKLILRYQREVQKRMAQIESLENGTYAQILMLRYMDGKRWEEIACIMGYSFRHVTRLHGQALAAFSRIMS